MSSSHSWPRTWPGDRRRLSATTQRGQRGGVRWNAFTDVIVGTAGIGVWLVQRGADELVVAAAEDLVTRARLATGGRKWLMADEDHEDMPGFSHGTAGVATFLALAGAATGRDDLVAAAIDGATHLLALARTDGGTCAVHHWEPGGEEEFPLGWRHGPTGLLRLFHALAKVTGDEAWATWRDRCARTVPHQPRWLRGE